ncbi:ATP-binding protein [Limibacter armeniacum]|uniref:AlbA family DNA-binding domain-containing protein n=1 Tax=Limibacter armeniacum TaxID=466084 RepID=UPI002FE5D715
MELSDLKKLIAEGESQTLDFKKTVSNVYKIAKTIVSFANTDGGILLIGVQDDKYITGVDPEEEIYLLNEASTFYCDPPIELTYEKVETEEGKTVLAAHVPNSTQKPHFSLSQKEEWNAYSRMNDMSVLASRMTIQLAEQQDEQERRRLTNHEESLLDYLHKYEKITSKGYARLVNVSERRAKRNLIDLTKEGIIRLHDFEKDIFYTLA